jgi:peptidyl-prolyl cis-trans isomerase SurA
MVAAVVLALAGPGARAELINGVKAIVHDAVVTYDEVNVASARELQYLQRSARENVEMFRAKVSEVLSNNLEQLLERQLILRDFTQAGYNLPESIVDEAVEERLREQFHGDRATFTKTLQADGITFEKFRQRLRDDMISTILRAKNVSQEVVISPHKIEKYYLEHSEKYKVEDEVKLRMIVLNKSSSADAASVRKLAEEIRAKIKEGASFAEMASIHSQGSQRREGGDWGWVEKSVLRKELGEVAFKLKAGEHSDVIELPEACYLMLVENVRLAHTRPLSEIRDEIERTLLVQERARLQKRYIDKLRNKTFVRYF